MRTVYNNNEGLFILKKQITTTQ